VRILVHAPAASAANARLRHAAAALALRGHPVLWMPRGGEIPPGVQVVEGLVAVQRADADVVIAEGAEIKKAALAGLSAGARAMVLSLTSSEVARWGASERLAWHSLLSIGLAEPDDAEAMQRAAEGLELDRIGLWSDAPAPEGPEVGHPDTEILERAAERALARHRGHAPRPAAFLDRDGTLVVERGYLADPEELELLPGVPQSLQNLRAAGFALIVISNQSGVGRGLFPLSRVYEAMARLRELLRGHGVELDAIYFCPHRPGDGCPCRKPLPGLLMRAAEDQNLDLPRSFMIGDKLIDAETGRAAGARGLLVRTGYGRGEEGAIESVPVPSRPDGVFDDLAAATDWVLGDSERPARS
jgi:histidinol-phosphate phosphatase family protein